MLLFRHSDPAVCHLLPFQLQCYRLSSLKLAQISELHCCCRTERGTSHQVLRPRNFLMSHQHPLVGSLSSHGTPAGASLLTLLLQQRGAHQ